MKSIIEFIKSMFSRSPIQVQQWDVEKILEDAIGNALLIVVTASENALPLDLALVDTILETKSAFKEGTLDSKLESKFWIAYQKAAQAVQPITINSIKANYDPEPTNSPTLLRFFNRKKIPLSTRCASNYKLISMITLLLLILVQIYWYLGWSITSDINTQMRKISTLNNTLIELSHQNTGQSAPPNARIKKVDELKISKIKQQIREHTEWNEAASHHLQNWNLLWSNFDFITRQPWQNADYTNFPMEVQKRIQFFAAVNVLQAITGYILPILYGLIGACFYILRQLPKEIDSLTFSVNSYIDYNLRMAQGPLAGILISYFFSADQNNISTPIAGASEIGVLDPGLNTLSPLAVAFLAGYSVEFIFRVLDRILSSPITDTHNVLSIKKANVTRTVKNADNPSPSQNSR